MIEPIKHLEPVPGQEMHYVYKEMVEKFNKMIDMFNEQMLREEKCDHNVEPPVFEA